METNDNKSTIRHVQIPHGITNSKINYLGVGVYAILRYYMNKDTKECFPSYKKLSEKSGLSRPTLKKYLDLLEKDGHITKISRGFKNSNLYKFNIDSPLYKNFEMFSYDFLDNKNLDFKSKSAYMVLQERMYKDGNFRKLCDTDINICKQLNVSYDTWKELYKTFVNDWGMSKTKTNAKDSESMDNKYLYTFDLETIGQAVLFNRKKIEEHDEMLHEMQEEIKRLNHEVKLLQKQSNAQNQEKLKSGCKLKAI